MVTFAALIFIVITAPIWIPIVVLLGVGAFFLAAIGAVIWFGINEPETAAVIALGVVVLGLIGGLKGDKQIVDKPRNDKGQFTKKWAE